MLNATLMRLRHALLFLPLLTAALAPGEANAQVATAGPAVAIGPVIKRVTPSGDDYPVRVQNLRPEGINLADCLADVRLVFNLTLTGGPFGSYHLQAWAGPQDCSPLAARTPGTATAVCWPLLNGDVGQVSPVDVSVRAQDIIAQRETATKVTSYTPATSTTCNQTGTADFALAVYFLWLDSSGNPVGTYAKVPVPTSTRGPNPPTAVTVGAGQALTLNWTPPTDSNIQGFTVYCDPAPGSESATSGAAQGDAGVTLVCPGSETPPAASDAGEEVADAGDAGDAAAISSTDAGVFKVRDGTLGASGTDGGCYYETTPASCGSSVFGSGTQTVQGGSVDGKYRCGDVGAGTATSASITGLKKGVTYTLAVAARDAYDNAGALSAPVCGIPVDTAGFWERYKASGGDAKGGLCALEAVGVPAPFGVFAAVFALSALGLWRRRKQG